MQSLFDGKLPRSVGRSQENGVRVWILAAVGADSASNQLTVVFPTPFTIGRAEGLTTAGWGTTKVTTSWLFFLILALVIDLEEVC